MYLWPHQLQKTNDKKSNLCCMKKRDCSTDANLKTVRANFTINILIFCRRLVSWEQRVMMKTQSGSRKSYLWSWTFRNACVTLQDGEVAPPMSQTLARAIYSPSVLPSSHSIFDLPSPSNSTEKIYQIKAYNFGVQFSGSKILRSLKREFTVLPVTWSFFNLAWNLFCFVLGGVGQARCVTANNFFEENLVVCSDTPGLANASQNKTK